MLKTILFNNKACKIKVTCPSTKSKTGYKPIPVFMWIIFTPKMVYKPQNLTNTQFYKIPGPEISVNICFSPIFAVHFNNRKVCK